MILVDLEQNSPEWIAEKLGKPSASNASKMICSDGSPSKQRVGYLYELAAERITGRHEEGYTNGNMEAGKEREEGARVLYELIHNCYVKKVGVIYKDKAKRFLCSPDGIVDEKYGLEMKNPLPKTQVKYLLDGTLPSDYFGQVQMSLYISGFPHWDFMSHVEAMKPLIIRVKPDAKYQAALEVELKKFCDELDEITKKLSKK